jgi:DNA/RNA-binding domain of Phe-tRNA-synthetase-like protein
MLITIKKEITELLPNFNVHAFSMDVKVEDSRVIDDRIKELEKEINEKYILEQVLQIPSIKNARDSYKKLGKDPSRYRLACESLFRRLVKGNGLYRVNNVVDAGNVLSIQLAKSTAVLDYDKIQGDINIRIGTENDIYYGIGRGLINVTNIPLYVDEVSPFGSPTSDTERTSITSETKKILLMVICFDELDKDIIDQISVEVFEKYAYANNINEVKVIKE